MEIHLRYHHVHSNTLVHLQHHTESGEYYTLSTMDTVDQSKGNNNYVAFADAFATYNMWLL